MIELLQGTCETVRFGDGSVLKCHDNDEAECYPMHWHVPVEIVMPVNNWYEIDCGKTLYHLREEDILIVQPGVLHGCIAPQEKGRRFFCQLSLFSIASTKMSSYLPMHLPPTMLITPELDKELHGQLRDLLYQIYEQKDDSLMLLEFSRCIDALALLRLAYAYFETHTFGAPAQSKSPESMSRLQEVCTHITEHYAEDLSLEELASRAGFSKYHFSRLFKSYTGDTFYHYLNRVRITHAQSMLMSQSLSITSIAYATGYSSISSFIRMFKAFYKCTPSDFRRMHELETQQCVFG